MSDQRFRLQASFPSETEEWAEDLLREVLAPKDEVTRTEDELFVASVRGGNVDAVTHARSFLADVEDAFSEGRIDIPRFTLEVTSVVGGETPPEGTG